jgi:hypothetical protein
MSIEVITINSDNLVRLDQLQNASTLAYVNSATVTFVLKDANGNIVVNTTSMPYVAASNGRYEGSITNAQSNALTENATYSIEITATYLGIQVFRKLASIAKYRSQL